MQRGHQGKRQPLAKSSEAQPRSEGMAEHEEMMRSHKERML
jgi:hypothetical protein